MYRFVSMTVLACVTSTGLAFAQVAAPAAPAPSPSIPQGAPAAPQPAGRGGFVPAPVVIGPSAPVPPEVAIPRPTPAELAQVNEAVKKFIQSDTSSTKP